jgi:hypothetical protein
MVIYGRSEEDWDQLADAGLAFLVERAHLAKLTSYTELNATLERRTGLPGFDFGRADERAAMGHLLYLIVERDRPSTRADSGHPCLTRTQRRLQALLVGKSHTPYVRTLMPRSGTSRCRSRSHLGRILDKYQEVCGTHP